MGNVAYDLPGFTCSAGWQITGYYLPSEDDYGDAAITVSVAGLGQEAFPGKFLGATKMEGWGKTRFGWFLGWEGGQWVKAAYAKDARDGRLDIGCVAVDTHQIPLGTVMRIPSAPATWGELTFTAGDTGGAIKGKHVDIFCGFGEAARQQTLLVTSDVGTVCIRTPGG
jgi:3D (Asp-Asp-Asp) domain-containing protein